MVYIVIIIYYSFTLFNIVKSKFIRSFILNYCHFFAKIIYKFYFSKF